jgi:pantothenate synthetase
LKIIGKEINDNKQKKFIMRSERKPMKLNHNLHISSSSRNIYLNQIIRDSILNINNEINYLENLITKEKKFIIKIKDEYSYFSNKYLK